MQGGVELPQRRGEVLEEPAVSGADLDEVDPAFQPVGVEGEDPRESRGERRRDMRRRQEIAAFANGGSPRSSPLRGRRERRA